MFVGFARANPFALSACLPRMNGALAWGTREREEKEKEEWRRRKRRKRDGSGERNGVPPMHVEISASHSFGEANARRTKSLHVTRPVPSCPVTFLLLLLLLLLKSR